MLAAVLAAAAVAVLPTPDAAPAVATQDVTFTTSDGQQLGGQIFRPAGEGGELPGMVLVHGSGGGNPWESLTAEAEAFARQGIVVLAPDKRSVGYSASHRDYAQLAGDALAALDVLAAQPGVARTGLWGISEGGWVAPIAAARDERVQFVVTVGGPGWSPLRSQIWNAANKLHRSGVQGSLRHTYPSTFHRLAADAGLFAAPHHDPAPWLRRLDLPVLALWGAEDEQIPPADSAARFLEAVPGSLTVRFFAGANHSLHPGTADGMDLDSLTPGYADVVGRWVRAVAAGDVPASSSEPLPDQATPSTEPALSAWWESWPVQVGTAALLLLAFTTHLVTALVARRRAGCHWPAVTLAAAGAAAIAGLVYQLLSLLASSGWQGVDTGPLVAGRPLPWLVAQLLSAVALVATLAAVVRWRSARLPDRLVTVAGALFVPWAGYWGLLLP
jgi:dienelactone hydrolase